uniref:VLIG-type G domain-containing protein n=1 Tax=Monopterus albus TaxID=43700 RepID=A0A3Q3IRG2_MONAL
MENKDKFRADFKDVFNERDQCQKKAKEFTNQCLKPAVEDFVNRSLGTDITGEMRTKPQFSTRMFCQYSILQDLLSKHDFDKYLKYICSYEKYVKKWILDQIQLNLSNGSKVSEFEDRHIQSSITNISDAIKKAKMQKSDNLKEFVEFAHWLTESVKEMGQDLREKFKEPHILTKLNHLHVKPQNELFSTLIGCGKQCPFCKSPCEAGGGAHTEHFASLHRPEGLGTYRWTQTNKLATDICSSLVISDGRFRCHAINNAYHPYKDYRNIFPDWKIPPDGSLQASDYWKYVMAKFNNDFAKEYDAKHADIPSSWYEIKRNEAEESLKKSFSIK